MASLTKALPAHPQPEPEPSSASLRRWDELLGSIADLVPAGPASVLIDGGGAQMGIVAGRVATALNAAGRPCFRLPGSGHRAATATSTATDAGIPCIPTSAIVLAEGARWRQARGWDVVIWLRTPPDPGYPCCADGEAGADIVVDLQDPSWPVVRRVAASLGGRGGPWYITETRAFFAARAATWDAKFGDDLPAYAAAIAQASIAPGAVVLDVGCGTGRALPSLRDAIGPHGRILAVDLTLEMLAQARVRAAAADATLILADARRLPIADASADAIFAAGLIMHLPDPGTGLCQLARITRTGGLLILFHPSGRAALAARHGRALTPGDPLDEAPLRCLARDSGWRLTTYDDAAHRFLAIAVRRAR